MTEDTPTTGDAPMVELRFVIRREFGHRRRYVADPAAAAAWDTITGRTKATIRDEDVAALAVLGVEVVEEVPEDDQT